MDTEERRQRIKMLRKMLGKVGIKKNISKFKILKEGNVTFEGGKVSNISGFKTSGGIAGMEDLLVHVHKNYRFKGKSELVKGGVTIEHNEITNCIVGFDLNEIRKLEAKLWPAEAKS